MSKADLSQYKNSGEIQKTEIMVIVWKYKVVFLFTECGN